MGVYGYHIVPPTYPTGDGKFFHGNDKRARGGGALGALLEEEFVLHVRIQLQKGDLHLD